MLTNIVIVIFGIFLIVFRKSILRQQDRMNRNVFKMKYSSAQLKLGEIIGLVIGIVVVMFGVLGLLGVV